MWCRTKNNPPWVPILPPVPVYHNLCLGNFLKTNLAKFAAIWKRVKRFFLFPISSKNTLEKKKEKGNRRVRGRTRGSEKKGMVVVLAFTLATLEKLLCWRSLFGGKFFKNPARCKLPVLYSPFQHTGKKLWSTDNHCHRESQAVMKEKKSQLN